MRQANLPTSLAALAILLSACAANSGTRPQDMSAVRHDDAAHSEEVIAGGHDDQADPTKEDAVIECDMASAGAGGAQICWADTVNPTAEHRQTAEQHRALAQQHRAASSALREAEVNSCSGVSSADRDLGPFAHKSDIRSVKEFNQSNMDAYEGYSQGSEVVGATVVLNPVRGLTGERLRRVVDCHLARYAVLGPEVAELSYCPLAVHGASATVRSVGDGFAIDVRGQRTEDIEEILRRAKALTVR